MVISTANIKGILGYIRTHTWASGVLLFFFSIAVFAPFLANDRPLVAQYGEDVIFPIFGSDLPPQPNNINRDWYDLNYDFVLWPIIPFHSTTIIRSEQSYKSPLSQVKIGNNKFTHYFGTDQIGRDVAAAIVHGTRIAFFVGFVACIIAFGIGIILGLIAGYFGNDRLRISIYKIVVLSIIFSLALFYLTYANTIVSSWKFVLLFVTIFIAVLLCRRLPKSKTSTHLPIDSIINRIIEIIKSIPNLLILLVVLSLTQTSSIYSVAIIIGLLGWPNVARLVRGEVLNIKEKEYIKAAELMQLSHRNILFKQLLPNIRSPLMVAFAFSVSAVIITEATISFLGIGVSPDQISWGALLSGARNNIQAWWLAVFPGICIFLLVLSLNRLGDFAEE